MYPTESETASQNGNFVEVVTSKLKINFEKLFKYLIFVGCVLFLLIFGVYLGFKHSADETDEQKQCLTGYYNFPNCISK